MRAFPLDHLVGALGDRDQTLGQLEEERPQPCVAPALGLGRIVGKHDGHARNPVEFAQIVNRLARRELLRRGELGYDRYVGRAADEELIAAEGERERVPCERLRTKMSGRESCRRVHGVRLESLREIERQIADPLGGSVE